MPSESTIRDEQSDAIKERFEDQSDLLSQFRQRKSLLPKLYGAKGGMVTALIYGSDHMSRIAKAGWRGDARENRLEKHRRSLARARAVLKKNREAQKRYGKEWMISLFRERLHATGDPKRALRNLNVV
jgi:hypothetical protein